MTEMFETVIPIKLMSELINKKQKNFHTFHEAGWLNIYGSDKIINKNILQHKLLVVGSIISSSHCLSNLIFILWTVLNWFLLFFFCVCGKQMKCSTTKIRFFYISVHRIEILHGWKILSLYHTGNLSFEKLRCQNNA